MDWWRGEASRGACGLGWLVFGIVNSVFVKGNKESALTAPSGVTYAIPADKLKDC